MSGVYRIKTKINFKSCICSELGPIISSLPLVCVFDPAWSGILTFSPTAEEVIRRAREWRDVTVTSRRHGNILRVCLLSLQLTDVTAQSVSWVITTKLCQNHRHVDDMSFEPFDQCKYKLRLVAVYRRPPVCYNNLIPWSHPIVWVYFHGSVKMLL